MFRVTVGHSDGKLMRAGIGSIPAVFQHHEQGLVHARFSINVG